MPTPGDGPVASVVIPAYNEEARIGELLSAIACAESGPELEIIVVCNGCTDRTLEIASGFQNVRTIDEPVGSKILALNRGDEIATVFPRVYLDADVLVTREDLIHFVDEIHRSQALAYGVRIEFDTKGASWMVRRYYDFWRQTPYFSASRDVGSGLYALTQEARGRFGRFPTLISDDGYVNFLFDEDEKEVLHSARMVVHAPRRLLGLLKIKARSFAGRKQLRRRYSLPSVRSNSNASLLSTALGSPANAIGFAVFISVQLVCRLWGRVILLRGQEDFWLRDETARTQS